jgi:hypothetical protein
LIIQKWTIQNGQSNKMDDPKIDPLDVANKSRAFPHLLLLFFFILFVYLCWLLLVAVSFIIERQNKWRERTT